MSIEQVGIGGCTDVGKIGGVHLHLCPHLSIGYSGGPAVLADIINEVTDGTLVVVVVVRLLLQLFHDMRRVFVGPVRQHHHIVAVVAEWLGFLRVYDQRPIDTNLFLKAGMAVVPVGAVLFDLELVHIHTTRLDTVEAQAGYAVHVHRQDDSVPMNRGVFFQTVPDSQGDRITFTPAQ